MKSSLVSVIIPAYNHGKYVQETIESIINQTYKNIELIVIDDGSKDNTWPKIQELKSECEKRFERVVFKTKENEGTCLTLNQLISESRGNYVFLIASDDLAKPAIIEKEVAFLENNPQYALCVGDNEIIDADGKRSYWDRCRTILYDEIAAKYITFGGFLRDTRKDVDFLSRNFGSYASLLRGNYISNGYTVRKSALNDFKFSLDAPLEDWAMMLHLSKNYKFKYLDEVLYSYRWHDSNTVKQTDKMIKIANQTIEYEHVILTKLRNQKLLKLYNLVKRTASANFWFKIFGILYVYKSESKTEKQIFLEFFRRWLFVIKFNRKRRNK